MCNLKNWALGLFLSLALLGVGGTAWANVIEEDISIILGPGESYQGVYQPTGAARIQTNFADYQLEIYQLEQAGTYGELLEWKRVPVAPYTNSAELSHYSTAIRLYNSGARDVQVTIPVRWQGFSSTSFDGMDIRVNDSLCLWVYGVWEDCKNAGLNINWKGYHVDRANLPDGVNVSLAQYDKLKGMISTGETVAYVLFGSDGYIDRVIPFQTQADKDKYGRVWLSGYNQSPILVTYDGYQGYGLPTIPFDRAKLNRLVRRVNSFIAQ